MHTITDKKLLMLRPQEIRPSPYTSRMEMKEQELEALSQCIASCGVIEPLIVRKNERGFYEIVCGERRLKAAKMAKLRRVPCIVHSIDSITAAIYSLSENLQSKPLNFFDEAYALNRLIKVYGITHTEVAFRLGISQAYLKSKLKLLKLEEGIKDKLCEENLPEQVALLLLKIPPEKRMGALDEIVYKRLDVYKARELINDILNPKDTVNKKAEVEEKENTTQPLRKAAVGDIRIYSNSLLKLYESMISSGVDAKILRRETDSYIEYKIRLPKREEIKPQPQLAFKI